MAQNKVSSSTFKGLTWAVAAAVGLVAWFVFRNATRGAMLRWDDDVTIQYNVHLRELSAENLSWMFTDSSYVRRYVPLGWLAFAVNYRLFGPGPHSFLALNLALHCADTALVFLLILKLVRIMARGSGEARGWLAFAAAAAGALLWAVHPLRVEAVSRACGMYCQAAFFLLLSILAYLECAGMPPGSPARRWMMAGSVLAFAMSLTSYPLAMGYAGVLIVVDALVLNRLPADAEGWAGRRNLGVWLEKIPFVAVTAAVMAVTIAARYHSRSAWIPAPTLAQFGLGSRILQAGYIWAYYVWKPLVPFNLSPVYTTLVWFNPLDPKFAVSLAAVIAISALLFWRRREWPGTLALWLCHLVLLVPVLGLTEHPHFANDRYSYLVAIPVSAAVAILLVQCGKRPLGRFLALAGAAAAIALCGKASAAQVGIWRDSGTLFHYMLSKLGPDPYRADILVRLGRLDRDEGRQAEAVAAFQEAVRAEPNWSLAHYELGSTLVHAGESERGISELRETLRIEPGMLEALDDLAGALFSAGRVPESIMAMKEVLRTAPSAVAYYDLSVMYGREGRFEEAVRACDEALRLDPNDARTLALKKALVGAKEK